MTYTQLVSHLVKTCSQLLLQQQMLCVVAESCTGGSLAAALTARPGSSQWFERGFVTYSNLAKQQMLGVKELTLIQQGAVSEATVREMAEGALITSQGEISAAISGIAGPSGGSDEKPVGTVWIAIARKQSITIAQSYVFTGTRVRIRQQAVIAALQALITNLSTAGSKA